MSSLFKVWKARADKIEWKPKAYRSTKVKPGHFRYHDAESTMTEFWNWEMGKLPYFSWMRLLYRMILQQLGNLHETFIYLLFFLVKLLDVDNFIN